jgi:hypothetical protein
VIFGILFIKNSSVLSEINHNSLDLNPCIKVELFLSKATNSIKLFKMQVVNFIATLLILASIILFANSFVIDVAFAKIGSFGKA